MTRRPNGKGGLLAAIDRGDANPLCPDCEYRMKAISTTESACERCGQMIVVEARAALLVARAFGGTVETDR